MRTLLNAYCSKCDFRHDGVRFGAATEDDTPLIPAIDDNGQFVVAKYDEDDDLSYYHNFGMNRGKEGPDWIETFGIFHDCDLCAYCSDCKLLVG